MADVTSTIQFKLGGVWTDISDIKSAPGITARRGILGSNPYDRVAAVGVMEFTLDNSSHNSGAKVGYYSPDHANKRANFGDRIPVRWKLVSGANTRYVFCGKISAIDPEPGIYGPHDVTIMAEDYMTELLDGLIKGISVQIDKRTDQLIGTLVTNIGVSPTNTDYDTTPDTFPYALDSEDDESTPAMTCVQKAAQSDASLVYVAGNNTDGETLVVRSRNTRAAATGSAATISDSMTGVSLKRGKETIYNDVAVSVAQRQVDMSVVVLWSQPSEIIINPGETITLTARYTDPDSRAERISLYPGSEVTPVADTDYRMSSISGNSGNNMTGNLTVNVTWGGNTAEIELTNSSSPGPGGAPVRTGYINLLQLRGKGMYLYSRQDLLAQDPTSISSYGKRSLPFTLPYANNPNVAIDIGNSILSRYKDPVTHISTVEFVANYSDALMAAALTCDIGSRIYVSETVTGIAGYHFINSVDYALENGKLLRVTWGLAPANTTDVWILGDSVLSVLGSTTIPNTYI